MRTFEELNEAIKPDYQKHIRHAIKMYKHHVNESKKPENIRNGTHRVHQKAAASYTTLIDTLTDLT